MPTQLEFVLLLPDHQPRPVVLILGLTERIRKNFPQLQLSTHWLIQWARETLGEFRSFAGAARAADDDLDQLHDQIVAALANDPPATRRAILRALDRTHANTEALASALEKHLPKN